MDLILTIIFMVENKCRLSTYQSLDILICMFHDKCELIMDTF